MNADNMFRSLGYQKTDDSENGMTYTKGTKTEVQVTRKGNVAKYFGHELTVFTVDEIMAAAKLIQERRSDGWLPFVEEDAHAHDR